MSRADGRVIQIPLPLAVLLIGSILALEVWQTRSLYEMKTELEVIRTRLDYSEKYGKRKPETQTELHGAGANF